MKTFAILITIDEVDTGGVNSARGVIDALYRSPITAGLQDMDVVAGMSFPPDVTQRHVDIHNRPANYPRPRYSAVGGHG